MTGSAPTAKDDATTGDALVTGLSSTSGPRNSTNGNGKSVTTSTAMLPNRTSFKSQSRRISQALGLFGGGKAKKEPTLEPSDADWD